MKNAGKRVLALLVCICLCVGLFPGTSAFALASKNDKTVEANSLNDLADSFSGIVFEYHDLTASEGKNAVRLDVYTHVTNAFKGFSFRLAYDSSSVLMTDTSLGNTDDYAADEYVDYTLSAVFSAKIDASELLTAKGTASSGLGSGKLTVGSSNILTGGAETETNALFTAQPVQVGASREAGENMRTVQINIVTNQMVSGIKDWYVGVDATNYTFALPEAYSNVHGKDVKVCSLYFAAKDGKTFTPNTFGIDPGDDTDFVSGVRFLDHVNGLVADQVAFVGFPQATPELHLYENITGQVKKTESGSDLLTTGGTAKIYYTEKDGNAYHAAADRTGTATEYTISSDGKLLAGDSTEAKLSMWENETYLWTVEPTDVTLATAMGTATATQDGDQITLWAQGADAKTYTLSVGKDSANLSGATVTVKDASNNVVLDAGTTDSMGKVTFQGYPGLTYTVEISAPGCQTLTGTVTTAADGSQTIASYGGALNDALSGGQIMMPETQTVVKVTVKYLANDKESPDAVVPGAIVTVLTKGSFTADSSGVATLNLGNGTYTLRASGGGRGTGADGTLEIDGTDVKLNGTALTAAGDGSYAAELRVGQKLEDPLYNVQGEWVNESDHSQGMTFKVYLENVTAALDGTFGFQWDGNVFTLADADFVPNTEKIDVPKTTDSTAFPVKNPIVPVDSDEQSAQYQYHGFYWQAKYDTASHTYTTLDASSGGVLIATYTLKVKDGVTDVDSVLTDKTVAVRSFLKTSGAKAVNDKFGAGTALALDAMSAFWQNIDQAEYRNEAPYKLDDSKALDGGFYQITQSRQNPTSLDDATIRGQDIMMVIEYPSSNLAVKFHTKDPSEQPIAGATVTIQDVNGNPIKDKDGNEIVGQTDAYGDVTLQVPTGDPEAVKGYYFSVKKNGFKKYPETTSGNSGVQLQEIATANGGELPDVIQVKLEPDDSAKVFLNPNARLNLLGSNRAPMNTDYLFNVDAKPGYTIKPGGLTTGDFEVKVWQLPTKGTGDNEEVVWTDGTDPSKPFTPPDGVTLNKTLQDVTTTGNGGAGYNITVAWDSASNNFKIAAGDVTMNGFYLIEIIVKDEDTTVPPSTGYKVDVQADAAGGHFDVDAQATSTFNPTLTDGKNLNAVVETLTGGATESSTYHFYAKEPDDPTNQALKAANATEYEGYVIDELYINGVAVALTDAERIHGVQEKLINIADDQSIRATYTKAKINAKDTDNPADDVIIEETDPVGGALVTMVLGQHGAADTITYDAINNGTQAEDTTVDYTVTGTSFSAKITAASGVTNPGGGANIDYEIDKIYVIIDNGAPQCIFSDDAAGDGAVTAVTVADVTWNGESTKPGSGTPAGFKEGTVTVNNLASGKHVTILATFKVDGEAAMQAWVQTVNKGGNGNISPSGMLAYNIGAEPVFTITPDAGWNLSALTVQVGSGSANGRKSDATVDSNGVWTYKMDPLAAGTTELAYTFAENGARVQLTVHYGSMTLNTIIPRNHAEISYTRTAGGDGTDKSGTIAARAVTDSEKSSGVLQSYTLDLMPGTWTITVKKNGYLPFTITDFTIKDDGTVDGTYSAEDAGVKVIYFGTKDDTVESNRTKHYIAPGIGDADWNGLSVNLRDISQMVNGMAQGAAAVSQAHADLDESGAWAGGSYDLTDDYGYVLARYGSKWTDYKMTYAEFMANAVYVPAT